MKRLQHITRQSQAIGNKKIEDRNFKFVTNYTNQTKPNNKTTPDKGIKAIRNDEKSQKSRKGYLIMLTRR